jgi:hypothetical protein
MGQPPVLGMLPSGIQSAIVGRIKLQEFAVPPVKFRAYVRVGRMGFGHFAQRGPQLHDTLCGSLRVDESVGCCRRLIYVKLVTVLAHMKRQQIGLGNGTQVRRIFFGICRGKRLDLGSSCQIRSAMIVLCDLFCPGCLVPDKADGGDQDSRRH